MVCVQSNSLDGNDSGKKSRGNESIEQDKHNDNNAQSSTLTFVFRAFPLTHLRNLLH